MNIPVLNRANVPTPPAGEVFLFLDADNSNQLTYKTNDCLFVAVDDSACLNPQIIINNIDDCLCEIVADLACRFGSAVQKSVITVDQFNTWWASNVNLYRNLIFDPLTCSYTESITTSPVLFVVLTKTNVLCNGDSTGTASLSVTGGVGAITIVWDGGAAPSALPAGSQKVTITDSTAPTPQQIVKIFTITEPSVLALAPVTTPDSGSIDGTASAIVTGGTAPYTYDWRDNGGTPIGQTTQTATGLSAGIYQVFVTDANGCTINDLNIVVA